MNSNGKNTWGIAAVMTSARVALATMTVCCLLYGLVILVLGRIIMPYQADGSAIGNEKGEIVGSELIAQAFSRPDYFWPRPSAVGYDASAAGGGNLSPANPELRSRAISIMAKMGRNDGRPVPADLVTASGSGLDPHITLEAAMFQAERVASARGLSLETVTALLATHAQRPGGVFTREAVVNVLLVNMALDNLEK